MAQPPNGGAPDAPPVTPRTARPVAVPPASLQRVSGPQGGRCVLNGDWRTLGLGAGLKRLQSDLDSAVADPTLFWDLSGVQAIDHTGAILLWRSWGRKLPQRCDIPPRVLELLEELPEPPQPAARQPMGPGAPLVGIGNLVFRTLSQSRILLTLAGTLLLDFAGALRNTRRFPALEVSAGIYRTGVQALGITALVGFLIGVVLSYLSANILHSFGADVYVINLLGIATVRELGPMLAAILVAGRSGSAIAAQLGVMRLNQELDALAVMGIPFTQRLILPKVIALAISMPLLVLWTDVLALFGGMVSARATLGLSYSFFVSSLPAAIPVSNYWIGIGKGAVFGALIALIASHYGLQIKPNTESLGEGTTRSVVVAITGVIVADAFFAVLFSQIGL